MKWRLEIAATGAKSACADSSILQPATAGLVPVEAVSTTTPVAVVTMREAASRLQLPNLLHL